MCHRVTPGAGVSHNTLTVSVCNCNMAWGTWGSAHTQPLVSVISWPHMVLSVTSLLTSVSPSHVMSVPGSQGWLVSAAQSRSGNWLRVSARSSLAAINSLSLSAG